jgi:Tfp pilus assembly protein PilW
MTKTRQLNKGFTLIELMIAMFLSIMVISGIFALFRNQVAIHNT